MKYLVDTNVLLEYPEIFTSNPDDIIVIHTIVAGELDNQIHNKYGNNELAYKARMARNAIKLAENKEYSCYEPYNSSCGLNLSINDDLLIQVCVEKELILCTNDLCMQIKADTVGVKWIEYGKQATKFKGWRRFENNTEWINNFHSDIGQGINSYKLLTNEYVEIVNTDLKDSIAEYRFDGSGLLELKLPPSKVIKGLNSQQRFALDLLYNKDIPVKVIVGNFGSGKTMLTVKMALYMAIEKEIYKDITLLRTPVEADGISIGFLPGTKQEKIGDYFKCYLQYIDSRKEQDYAERLIYQEKIKMDVVTFLKGMNIEDSFIIMDECEDLNLKLLKLVGTRMASRSCIVFTGDYKQAEARFKHDNGIIQFIDKAKGNPLVGIVVLDEDVRSEASKVFADL